MVDLHQRGATERELSRTYSYVFLIPSTFVYVCIVHELHPGPNLDLTFCVYQRRITYCCEILVSSNFF